MTDWNKATQQWLHDFAPQGILVTDAELNIRGWNNWLETHSGRSAADVMGRNLLEVYPELVERGLDRYYRDALAGQVQVLSQRLHRYLLPMPLESRPGPELMAQSAHIAPLIEKGRVIGAITVIEDVTERVERENALRESEARYRRLVETMSDGLEIMGENGLTTYANDRLCEIWGYPRDEIIGRPVTDFLDAANQRIFREQMARRREGGQSSYEITFTRKDGSKIPTIISPKPLFDAEGRFSGAFAVITDITERVRAEERIAHLNLVLRAIRKVNQLITRERDRDRLLQSTCDILTETRGYLNAWIALLDESSELVTATEAGWGEDFAPLVEQLKRGELPPCGQRALKQLEVVTIKDPVSGCTGCPLSAKLEGLGAMTARLEHRGKVYGLLTVSIPSDLIVDEEEHALLEEVAGDIAFALHSIELEEERQRAEEALAESERRYRSLFENMPEIVYALSTESRFTLLNPAFERLTDWSVQEWLGKPFDELIHPEDREMAQREFRRALKGETRDFREMRIVTKAGETWVMEVLGVAQVQDGQVVGVTGFAHDITERKRAEEALRESEERFHRIADTASEAIVSTDNRGNIVYWNQAAQAMFGYRADEAIGKPVTITIPERRRERFEGGLRETISTGSTSFFGKTFEGDGLRKDGSEFPSEFSLATWKSKGARFFTAIIRDVTERKRAEESLRESEEKLRVLFDGTYDLITLTDANATTLWANPAWEDVFGEDLAEQEDPFKLIHPDDLDKAAQAWNALVTKKEAIKNLEYRFEVEDGEYRFFESSAYPVTIGGELLFYVVARDITERKRTEEELLRSFERLQRSLTGTVNVLTSTIEIKDPYTAGHQRRVAQLACAIAREMGLSVEEIAGLHMAALIHDIGKISIPAEILSKPVQLNELEWSMIKAHPKVGYNILKTAEFPWLVAQIVLEHHERLDGSGYPQGLSSTGILMKARILTVADVVEAMASHRPYRPARGLDKALEEILQNRGILYDPEVVDVCLKLFAEKKFELE